VVRRLLVGLVLVVIGALVAVELAGTAFVDHDLANQAQSSTGATGASVSMGPFPVLYHVLAEGRVPSVHATLSGVPVGPLRIHQVKLVLTGVSVSRGQLVSHRRIRVTSIRRAEVTAYVTSAELTAAVGETVTVTGGGNLDVDVAGIEVTVSPKLDDGSVLVIDVSGIQVLDVDLAKVPLLSACRFSLQVSRGQLQLTCNLEPVPPSVVQALSSGAA
jgi:hypothetical protein